MQELDLNYPMTKDKLYSEEEDRHLLYRLLHYGMPTEDLTPTEFPVVPFEWFSKAGHRKSWCIESAAQQGN